MYVTCCSLYRHVCSRHIEGKARSTSSLKISLMECFGLLYISSRYVCNHDLISPPPTSPQPAFLQISRISARSRVAGVDRSLTMLGWTEAPIGEIYSCCRIDMIPSSLSTRLSTEKTLKFRTVQVFTASAVEQPRGDLAACIAHKAETPLATRYAALDSHIDR